MDIQEHIDEMVNHTDLYPWYWMSYGDKCYAFAVVVAYPVKETDPLPEPGSKLILCGDDNEIWWEGLNGVEMIIESEISNIEQQNGDVICSFIASAHAILLKDHIYKGL